MALDAGIDREGKETAREHELQKMGGYAGFEALRGPLSRGIQETVVWVAPAQESTRAPGWVRYSATMGMCGSRCHHNRAVIGLLQSVSPDDMTNNGHRKGTQAGSCNPSPWQNHLRTCVPSTTLSPGTPVFSIYLPHL